MADLKVKISEFPLATEAKDSDDIAILQDGVNKRIKTPKIEEKILEKVEERYVNKNKLGVNNGVATLGSDGLLSLNQRPPYNVQASFVPINLLSPPSELDGVFVPTESGVYENYGNIEIDLNDGTYIITKIGEQYEKSLLSVQSPKSVNTISELRSREGDFEGQIITLLGYYEAGDKEPLNYKWTSEQGVDDGGGVINTEDGSWMAIFKDYINVKDFGAYCNYVNSNELGDDDSNSWQNAINYLKSHSIKKIVFNGHSRITTTLTFDFPGLVIDGGSVHSSRIMKTGNNSTSGIGIIGGVDYDGVDAVLMSIGYVGDFSFKNLQLESLDNSEYVLFLPKTYRFVLDDIYLRGGVYNLRAYQAWNCNLKKVRSRFSTYAFVFEGLDANNPEQHTSISFDNCYAEYADFGFKLVNVAYFSAIAVSSDNINECCYWFDFSTGALNGVGSEKSTGQLIRCWRSNITINGHQVLEIKNYTGTPMFAKSKAKFEIWTEGRSNTGLTINSSSIRGYSAEFKAGDAEWIHVGNNTSFHLINYNHNAILLDNISERVVDGILLIDNYDGSKRTQKTRAYELNEVDMLPSYSYAYNQKRILLKPDKIISINTMSTDASLTSISIPISDIIKVFPDFVQTDAYIRDYFQFKIKNNNGVSLTPFSRVTVNVNNISTIGNISGLNEIIIDGVNVVFNFQSAVNRPIVTITRLSSAFINKSENVADVSTPDATDLATALTLVNELKAKLNAKLTADRNSGQQAT